MNKKLRETTNLCVEITNSDLVTWYKFAFAVWPLYTQYAGLLDCVKFGTGLRDWRILFRNLSIDNRPFLLRNNNIIEKLKRNLFLFS